MNHTHRQKLLNELSDLEKLKKLYRKHVEAKLTAIRKLDERVFIINLLLTTDPD